MEGTSVRENLWGAGWKNSKVGRGGEVGKLGSYSELLAFSQSTDTQGAGCDSFVPDLSHVSLCLVSP